MSGFQFRSLQLTGPGLSPARVEFRAGLNVISGASNAGKSFIFNALDFACGAAGPLGRIPESDGYNEVEVVIEDSEGIQFSLRRSSAGGGYHLVNLNEPELQPIILGERFNRSDPNNISSFLLKLTGLEGKKVRKNAENELQDLSFRNLSHLIFVDEETIIKKSSPLHGTEATQKTAESNVFKLLLSGTDDALLVATKKKAIVKAELQAQIDLLDKLITEYRSDLAEQTSDAEDLLAQAERLDATLARSSSIVQSHRELLSSSMTARRTAWERTRTDAARREQVLSLVARFDLLEDHYTSDLARLEALAEAGSLFPALNTETCPLCGAPRASHSHPEEQAANLDIARVREACLGETAKIEVLRVELRETVKELGEELSALDSRIRIDQQELQRIADEISGVLEVNLEQAETTFRDLSAKRYQVKQAIALTERIADLVRRQEAAASLLDSAGPVRASRADLPPVGIEALRSAFESVLTAWDFPVDGQIVFDTRTEDFIVGSRRRSEQGKGSRALTHAAFTVALMQACDAQGLSHPGFVALDSPLVTFRDRDVDSDSDLSETKNLQVKDAFYRDLVTRTGSRQIIIFENEEPQDDLRASMNFLHFTGDPIIPRSGFFPQREGATPAG
jgi:hypothetical protein